ncbi:alpha-1,2-fucosyltransferase, partial [Vibrio breoganii]
DRYTNFNFIKGRNVFLDGYFFEKLTQFQFDFACDNIFPLIWPEKIHNLSDRIAVHIRGGDFLNFEQYHICDESYYLDNINRILSMYGDKKIYVVSDDIEYSRKLLTRFKHSVDFISSDMMSDFDFISSSRFIIGSNSTFCFWSALVSGLKSDENKRIILPGEWRRGIQRKIRIKSELI